MKHTKKLALLLAGIILSQSIALSGCSDSVDSDTESSTETESVSETSDETKIEAPAETTDGLIGIEVGYDWQACVKKADYDGHVFNIMNGNIQDWYAYLNVTAEETTGEPVNDAVYERIQRTNEYLNVNVIETIESDASNALRAQVKAGLDDYDVTLQELMHCYTLAIEGNALELKSEVPGLDMSGVWWDQNSINDLSINNKLYFVTSDFDTSHGLENPYDIVDSGKWTIDKFIEMAEKTVSDADGNGVMTDTDSYGYIGYVELVTDLMLCGAGIKYIDKDHDTGMLIDGTTGEKTVDVYSKIYRLLWGGSTTFDIRQPRFSQYLRGLGDRIQEQLFVEDRALFYSECMAWTRVLREMEADFGVLPPPKYDEAQDRYYSIIIDPFMQMIPITAKNAERTGNILDVLAAASHDTVVDAYVNVTLSGKVARDADTVRMLRLVFDDLSYSIYFAKVPTRSTIVTNMGSAKENIVSALKTTGKVANKVLKEMNEEFFD